MNNYSNHTIQYTYSPEYDYRDVTKAITVKARNGNEAQKKAHKKLEKMLAGMDYQIV